MTSLLIPLVGLPATIPSPSQGVWHLGPLPIRAYALCIIAGIVLAIIIGERRWLARGGTAGEMQDIADAPDPEEMDLGMPAEVITTTVDVSAYVGQKRAAMVAHASQIPDDSFFLQLPPDAFAAAFGQEWFIRRGPERATVEDTLVPLD